MKKRRVDGSRKAPFLYPEVWTLGWLPGERKVIGAVVMGGGKGPMGERTEGGQQVKADAGRR
jgi:hypothetical protein